MTDAGAAVVQDAVQAVRRGDHHAFGRIVELYQRRLFGLALMVTRDPAGAEDVAQDAFVRAFIHLKSYDERRPFYPWLSTIAVRIAQNWLVVRARAVKRESPISEHGVDPAGAMPDALAALIADEDDRRLWNCVAALPSGERTAVILHYREEMSVRDIARAMGVTDGTIKTLLFRARRRLRHTLPPGLRDIVHSGRAAHHGDL